MIECLGSLMLFVSQPCCLVMTFCGFRIYSGSHSKRCLHSLSMNFSWLASSACLLLAFWPSTSVPDPGDTQFQWCSGHIRTCTFALRQCRSSTTHHGRLHNPSAMPATIFQGWHAALQCTYRGNIRLLYSLIFPVARI